MSRIPLIIRSREKRREQGQKKLLGRTGFGLALTISLFFVALIGAVVFLYVRVSSDLPATGELTSLLDPDDGLLLEPTRLYARDGEAVLWVFENRHLKEREYAVLDLSQDALRSDIPPQVVKATLGVRDPAYFSDRGVNLFRWREEDSISRVVVSELLLWREPQGTLRDIHEVILANQLLTQYGREQVLEWYLNSAYYGRQTYGVGAAARVYFDKNVSDLNLAEAAVLAVVSEAPALNPIDAPRASRERQLDLLKEMASRGLITQEELEEARKTRLKFREPHPAADTPRPFFVEYALQQLDREIPRARLLRGGYKITTSIDPSLQFQVQCTVKDGLDRYRPGEWNVDDSCQAARLLPTYPGMDLTEDQSFRTDIIQIDPRSGQILAMYGAHPDTLSEPFSPQPPGSLLTPYIYLTAFTQGYEPAALVWDIPPDLEHIDVQDVHPACTDNCQYLGPVSIRYALANDYLVPAIEFWESFRPGNIENTLSQMGVMISSEPCSECQLFQGSHKINILDAAHSFGVFSRGGVLRGWPTGQSGDLEPVLVLTVEDYHGQVWRENPRVLSQTVISKQLAYMMTHVLSDSQARRQSLGHQNVFDIGRPVAVKRGFTYQDQGAWTVGFTPQLVTAVWIGETPWGEGAKEDLPQLSAGLWRALTQSALKGEPVLGWDQPPGMTTVEVCLPSGLLPTENCPETVREIFVLGSEPTQRDNLYRSVEINRETSRLATVFTPPELIEERTYLSVPPKARAWAEQEEIPIPPQSYDVAGETSTSGEVSISYPENFAFLRGQVVVDGDVPQEDLVSYRVQIGKGLNPDTWQQIGQEREQPLQGGVLVIWDTENMEDGLYAIQLVVVREGQKVEKASALVSIDNTSPEVSLDLGDGKFEYLRGKEILIRASAVDNASIDEVKFYINDELMASRKSPPFVVPWTVEPGTHDVRVLARDKAGNMDFQTGTFSVER